MRKRISQLCILLLGYICAMAQAEKADRTKPMQIEASEASLDQKSQTSLFSGRVIIEQGTMQLLANKVSVRNDTEGYQYAQGEGSPIKFKQKMDNSADYLEAQARRFDYNGKLGLLKLYENAWVRAGTDEVKGDLIIYDMKQETYYARTQNNGHRVKITIIPKQKD